MELNEDTIMLIIKIVCGVVAGATSILSVLSALFGGKWRGLYRNIKAVNAKTEKLMELIEEAESHTNYDSHDKLQYVVTNYNRYCIENKVPFNEEEVTNEVNQLIEMTNNVNKGIKNNGRSKEY